MDTTTMYAPNVYMRWESGQGAALRTIVPTLAEAKAILDAEVERAGKPALAWEHAFGMAVAEQGELRYEVLAVKVAVASRV